MTSPAACIAPSNIMRAGQQEGSFFVSTNLISLCPVTNVVSSAIGFYHPMLVGNQEQWQKLVLFEIGPLGYP